MGVVVMLFVQQVIPRFMVVYHVKDSTPVRKSAEVAIVYEYVNLQFPGEVWIVVCRLLGIVAVDGIELQSTLATPFYSLVQQFSLADTP